MTTRRSSAAVRPITAKLAVFETFFCRLESHLQQFVLCTAGSFGEISDPTSQALQEFLRRLQDQANQVRELIANQQTIASSAAVLRNPSELGKLGGIRASQGGAQIFMSVPTPPRVSEGAVSIESKGSKGTAQNLELVASTLSADGTIYVTTGSACIYVVCNSIILVSMRSTPV